MAEALRIAPELGPEGIVLVCLSGRGDKDMDNIRQYKEKMGIL